MKPIVNQHEAVIVQGKQRLWKDGNFLRLWIGQTISLFGSQISIMALPLIAAMTLDASPFEMGVLRTVEYVPFLLFGLFAGVWIDLLPKRPILITADFGRSFLLLSIPLLALFGALTMTYLWIVAFLVGVLTTFYAIGYQSILPYMLGKEQLTEGNAKMELSRSISETSGPGLAGMMVHLLTGAFAILIDVISFVISGMMMCFIKINESERKKNTSVKANIWKEIGDGLKLVYRNQYLRPIAACSATTNFFFNMTQAIFILYATKELGFSAATIGVLMTLSTIGALISALVSNKLVQRFGFGAVIVGSAFCQGIGGLFLFGAVGSKYSAFNMMFVSMFIVAFSTTLYNVAQISLRQSITESRLLGRMNATMRTIVWGVIPLGALAGGALGSWIGMYNTIIIAISGGLFSFLWVLFSPVRKVITGKTVNS